jgi:hypothetical protein
MRLAETRTAEGGGRQQGGTNEPISMDGHGRELVYGHIAFHHL